jgi:hypothetical protein
LSNKKTIFSVEAQATATHWGVHQRPIRRPHSAGVIVPPDGASPSVSTMRHLPPSACGYITSEPMEGKKMPDLCVVRKRQAVLIIDADPGKLKIYTVPTGAPAEGLRCTVIPTTRS